MIHDRPDRTLSVVVTAQEFDRIDGFAARYGMTPQEFLRRLVRNVSAVGDAFKLPDTPRSETTP